MSVSGDASEIDPDDAAIRDFPRVRKGFDPVEVRRHLGDLAQEIRRLQGVETRLRSELESARAEEFPQEMAALDPGAMSRALGDETVRIIDAAREAADEIRSKAEENASRVVRDAHERANRLNREALDARESAAADAEELTAAARATADATLAEARTTAELELADARAEAASLLEEAALVLDEKTTEAQLEAVAIRARADELLAEAEQLAAQRIDEAEAAATERSEESELAAQNVLDDAREQGREMIREAKEARERMIRDLAERRHASRQQLEALRAGRERLIEAFAVARAALDEATDELVDSLPSAREAADAAARAVAEDIDVATAELDALIERGADTDELIEGDPDVADEVRSSAVASSDRVATAELSDAIAPADDDVETDPAAASDAVAEVVSIEDLDADGDDDDDDAFETDGSSAIDETDDEPGDTESVTGGHLRLVSSNDGGPTPAGIDGLTADSPAEASESDGRPAEVEELFARLRADRSADDDDLDDDDLDDDDLDDDDDSDDGHRADITSISAGAVVIDLSSGDVGDTGGEAPGDPEVEAHQVLLDERDERLAALAQGLSRRIRRVVTDQENEVLDLVRRQRKLKSSSDLLPSRDDQAEAYRTAIHKDLREVLTAGADFLGRALEGGPGDTDATRATLDLDRGVDELMASVGDWAIDPLRSKLARIVDESEDTSQDRGELVDRIRATYREWRNDRIGEVAGDVATLAFSKGVMGAAAPGQKLCWVVDHGGLPCPDGEDNQLAGPVVVGDEFPTGDTCPPAHPGCRCLLVPATQ